MPIRPSTAILLLTMLMSFSGCATFRKSNKEQDRPAAVSRQPAFVGTIALVNEENGFVLIDNGLLPTPPTGLVLRSYSSGVESGELVTSIAQRRPFTIADIRHGTPRKGDRVFVANTTVMPGQAVSQPGPSTAPGVPPDAPEYPPLFQSSPVP